GIRDFHVTGVQTCALPIWACCPWRILTLVEQFVAGGTERIPVIAIVPVRRRANCLPFSLEPLRLGHRFADVFHGVQLLGLGNQEIGSASCRESVSRWGRAW